jgi:hypothetical protein
MTDLIYVRPAPALRRDFAIWAVAQTPKVRTTDPQTFAVPGRLFSEVPEPLMIGSTVDGHRYVSPDEDAANGTPPPSQSAPADASTAQEAATAAVASRSPEDVDRSMAAAVPAAEVADGQQEQSEGVFPCRGCDREFTSERGRDTHHRLKHPEG